MTYRITTHASERFSERFAGRDIEYELQNAVPFGAQRRKSKSMLLLSPCEAVFVIGDEQRVITALTKPQAMANMQAFIGSYKCRCAEVR